MPGWKNNDRSLGSTFAWLEFHVVVVHVYTVSTQAKVSVDSRAWKTNVQTKPKRHQHFFSFCIER